MNRRSLRILVSALFLLLIADIGASRLAHRHVMSGNYYFDLHYSTADLGEERGKRSDRKVHRVFWVYLFETCFFRVTAAGDEEWMFSFRYARPYPLLLGGRNLDSYRFKECGSGQTLKRVHFNGNVEEIF